MKKILILTLLALSVISFAGCKGKSSDKKSKSDASHPSYLNYKERPTVDATMESGDVISYSSMQGLFALDYTPEYPDSMYAEAEANDSKKKASKANGASSEKSESVIPGIRKLSDYVTKYLTSKPELKDYKPEDVQEEDDDPSKEFFVEDWGPQGKIVGTENHPTFYVIFSRPVHSLKALGKPETTSDIMTINPPLPGVFRWYGTKHLSFESDIPADPTVHYTISIKSDLKSAGGKPLTGNTQFETDAEDLSVINLWGGYIKNSDQAYSWDTGALPPYENRFVMRTNYTATVDSIKKNAKITVDNKAATYKIEPIYTDIFRAWSNQTNADPDSGRSNTFLVEITSEVPHNTQVNVAFNGNGKSKSYDTLKPFYVDEVEGMTEYSRGNTSWPLNIRFSQIPDIKTLVENVSFDFDVKLTEANFIVRGRNVKIVNLPLDYNQSHMIYFSQGLKDIYGQPLHHIISDSFNTPVEKGYAKFQNHGTTMLEAQYPHKMLFEHQNLTSGTYVLQTTDRPVGNGCYEYNKTSEVLNNIELGERNKRQFQEIELDPFLKNGYGFVRYDAVANYKSYSYWEEQYVDDKAEMAGVVQVTDMGVTARMSINKAVVMVRSLSTGKPVANAKVMIVHDLNDYHRWNSSTRSYEPKEIFVYENKKTYDKLLAEGTTDKNGLCVINYNESQMSQIENENEAFIYVVNGDDRVAFAPNSHNSWRSGIYNGSYSYARKAFPRTFMFVDRGIYKPGEIVTFRGIDLNQLMGTFIPNSGSYTIDVTGAWWDAPEIIDTISGTLSESGGFYGSFQLPDEMDRGYYNLIFKRTDGSTARITFTVADFERVKFESSITVPEITYYGGDKISAELSADYLAGGTLSGATYETSWYKSGTTFSTSAPEAKGYTFDTGVYSSRTYYSNEKGVLDANGKASLSCNSEKITDGSPYLYHVESNVTDISNQRISTQNDVFVHPALFYVGLAKARNIRGFAKSGQKLEIPYLLVNTDGNSMNERDVPLKVSSLEYKLTREVWSMVHEQSVDDSIYARYERSDVDEGSGTIKAAASGIIDFTPKTAGWYTLAVTGKDNRGNKVISKSEFYVSGSGASWYDQYNSYSLNLTPDQSQYNPGETATILLESPLPSGDYLITIEREGIFSEEIRHFDSSADVIEIPIAGNFVPVVYVSVSSYSDRHGDPTHNYGEPDLDKPKGYYGVTPLFVNPYVRSFSVDIECDKPSYKPGDTATIKFKATKGGKPFAGAELTAMAVDRGVLDIINYHVPNPIDFFYNIDNFPLRVYGGDSRTYLMDPVTYSVKDLKGGDASEDEEKEDERKDFRPTAFFEPVLITDENGEATVTFKMPDSLTTYRITAFGIKNDLFALHEEEVKVQNPINIQQVQPRRLRERDTAECGVLISNLSKDGQKVTVSLDVQTPTEDTEQDKLEGRKTIPGKGFVDGASTHTVYVASGQSSVVYFDVGATQQGTINLVYTIKSDLINERLISPIRVEKTFVYETVTMTGTVSDEKKGVEKEGLIIPGFAKEGRGDLSFTLDATRLGALGSSVNYLFEYPYGCMEQQSSRILPLVCFGEYIDIFGLDSRVADIKSCVKSFTKKWKDYQHSNGGFGYWPESEWTSDYVSMRILYVYAIAMQRGYTPKDIPIDVNSLKRYVINVVNGYKSRYADSNYYDYDKAFACYVFSLLDDHSLDYVRDELYSRADDITLDAAAYLSLAYSNSPVSSDMNKAKSLNKKIRAYLQPSQRSVTLSPKAKSGYWFFYQSETIQYAAILSAFASVDPKDEMVDRLIYTLLSKQSQGRWQNTITTAAVLDSIYTYIKKRDLDDTNYTARATLNGKKLMEESFKGVAAKPKVLKLPFEDEFISSLPKDKSIPLEFEKDGDGYLFYTVEMKYAIPDEIQAARNEGLEITYEITEFDTGKVINVTKDTSDLKLESGKLYKAKVYIQTNRTREYVAVRAPIPSGAEILDSTFVTTGSGMETNYTQTWSWRSRMSHKNITDNEAQFFWDEMHSGRYSFDFTFRATRRGVYPTPPVQAECMYEPEVFGRSDGYLFIIE